METAFLVGAFALFVGTSSGLVWWRLSPGQASAWEEGGAPGFEAPAGRRSDPVPPRPDEIRWTEREDPSPGWVRASRGIALAALIASAGAAFAAALYVAGTFVFHELFRYFGHGLR